jgi:hypothetical protein
MFMRGWFLPLVSPLNSQSRRALQLGCTGFGGWNMVDGRGHVKLPSEPGTYLRFVSMRAY